jgi:transposase
VNASEQALSIGRRRRRRHSAAFRAESVEACRQPGVSIAAVALARGLNANLLRRWVVEAESDATLAVAAAPAAPSVRVENGAAFVPVAVSARAECVIRIELRHGASKISVHWPASAARECALLLRELMR